jgi:hypothetical protein
MQVQHERGHHLRAVSSPLPPRDSRLRPGMWRHRDLPDAWAPQAIAATAGGGVMNAREFSFWTEIERDDAAIEVEVTYSVTPGHPETGPTYACGGTPAEPAEVEIYQVRHWPLSPGVGPLVVELDLTDAEEATIQAQCDAHAEEALADEASDYADYRRDQARDEQMTREWEDRP